MQKRMEDIHVFAGDMGHVVLKQSNGLEDDAVIVLYPEQVDLVIRWIREAAKELREA